MRIGRPLTTPSPHQMQSDHRTPSLSPTRNCARPRDRCLRSTGIARLQPDHRCPKLVTPRGVPWSQHCCLPAAGHCPRWAARRRWLKSVVRIAWSRMPASPTIRRRCVSACVQAQLWQEPPACVNCASRTHTLHTSATGFPDPCDWPTFANDRQFSCHRRCRRPFISGRFLLRPRTGNP